MRGPGKDQMLPYQPTYLALKRSAEGNCRLCQYFWQALGQDYNETRAETRSAVLANISGEFPGRQLSLTAWGGGSEDNLDRMHVITTGNVASPTESEDEVGIFDRALPPAHQYALDGVLDLYAYPEQPAALEGEVTGRPLPTEAWGSEDQDLVRWWLEQCRESHEHCARVGLKKLPKRVLDIKADPIRLVEPDDRQMALYVTLSHCWGGTVPLVTTAENLKAHKEVIPFDSLPKTFRDAVTICLDLDIRFVWIDSLCILQGSKDDWEDQAPRMSEIYADAYLNIAARGAENSSVGCFMPRPEPPPACALPHRDGNGTIRGNLYVRDPKFRYERIRDSPLDQRAWVYQERLLSPRIIYFGSQQLYWECATVALRQDGRYHDVLSDGMRSWNFKSTLDINAQGSHSLVAQNVLGERERFWRWYRIVEEYTRRKLTYKSDTLPAISGMAKAFSTRHGDVYIAGIWQEDLVNGLCWISRARPRDNGGPKVRTVSPLIEGSTFPTWIWARRCGAVDYRSAASSNPRKWTSIACEVVDLSWKRNTRNPFDAISDAALILQAKAVKAQYIPNPDIYTANVISMDNIPIGNLSADDAHFLQERHEFWCILLKHGWNDSVALAVREAESSCFERLGLVNLPIRHPTELSTVFTDIEARLVKLI